MLSKQFSQDLKAVDAVLSTLETTVKDQAHVADELKIWIENTKVALAVESCGKACDVFEKTVTHWMRHSTETKTFWWDKVRVGYFGEAKIKVFTSRLETSKATVSMALGMATFISNYSQMQTTEEIKHALLPVLTTKENELTREEQNADRQINEIGKQLHQLSVVGHLEETHDSEVEKTKSELVAEIQQYRTLLDGFKEVCGATRSWTRYERTGQNIQDVKMKESQLLVGMFNVQTKDRGIKQNLKNIDAVASSGIVGIAEGVDVNAFLRGAQSSRKSEQ